MFTLAQSAQEAARITLRDGGGTFTRAFDIVTPQTGYAVGLTRRTFREVSTLMLSWVDLQDCLDIFPDAPYIGTWIGAENTVHIDPVVLIPDVLSAMILGRALGQKAIWSFAGKNEIML